eukprot:scaffold15749_cov407-Ochromonas_danica.AAC.1
MAGSSITIELPAVFFSRQCHFLLNALWDPKALSSQPKDCKFLSPLFSLLLASSYPLPPHLPSSLLVLVTRGCMGMTAAYGEFDRDAQESESLRTIAKALELGVNFIDTAWIYQHFSNGKHYTNEEL